MNNLNKRNGLALTKDGLKKLQDELANLVGVKIPEVVDRLSKAREDGDLSENAAYQSAREELEFLQGRASELQDIIDSSSLIEERAANGLVDIGCQVLVKVSGKERTFHVVGEWEADPVLGKISGSSPLGKALLGKKVGEKVEVAAPAGKVVYEITGIN